ncbi:MAG: GreA/GreB family elongation factor [Elusimicrobiota bacterium]|jgi:transcription elongation GreA/GreB family factor
MSRAFIREDAAPDEEPPRPQSGQPNYVTSHGLEVLRERVAALAREREALKPDAADPAAGQRLRRVERDLVHYQGRLDSAILVSPGGRPADRVFFGATVVYRGAEGESRVRIVGEDEAADADGERSPSPALSWTSPLAQAFLGAKPGERVLWKRPAGDLELEVLSISYE